jgi:hypothetical protein
LRCSPPALATAQSSPSTAIPTTRYYAFYTDLTTNVDDALIAAASARLQNQPEDYVRSPRRAIGEVRLGL